MVNTNSIKSSEQQKVKIINVLEKDGELGLTISQIAEKIGLNRNSTAKYLEIMAGKGEIFKVEKGQTSKLFYPNRVARSFEERNQYMVRYYQLLHKFLFIDYLKDYKKAREIGKAMATEAVKMYVERFNDLELSFESISGIISMAVEITYPIANVKADVQLNPKAKDSFFLSIKRCICNGNPDYRSICEIQAGLFKGIMDELIFPQKVKV
ncbi:MAG: winged helix-turn-helix domain-containing protein, partial [Candidatus Helarchaeota archaeon]